MKLVGSGDGADVGITGTSNTGIGVRGTSNNIGVRGDGDGFGVVGDSTIGTGIGGRQHRCKRRRLGRPAFFFLLRNGSSEEILSHNTSGISYADSTPVSSDITTITRWVSMA